MSTAGIFVNLNKLPETESTVDDKRTEDLLQELGEIGINMHPDDSTGIRNVYKSCVESRIKILDELNIKKYINAKDTYTIPAIERFRQNPIVYGAISDLDYDIKYIQYKKIRAGLGVCEDLLEQAAMTAASIYDEERKTPIIEKIQKGIKYIIAADKMGYRHQCCEHCEGENYSTEHLLKEDIPNLKQMLENIEEDIYYINGQHLCYLLNKQTCIRCGSSAASSIVGKKFYCKCKEVETDINHFHLGPAVDFIKQKMC